MPRSPDNGQNIDGGISNFQTSGQSFMNDNFHNSRIINNIDLKVGLVTQFDKRNTATLKKFHYDAISTNCGIIDLCPIYGQFRAVLKPGSEGMYCKTYIFINSNFLS